MAHGRHPSPASDASDTVPTPLAARLGTPKKSARRLAAEAALASRHEAQVSALAASPSLLRVASASLLASLQGGANGGLHRVESASSGLDLPPPAKRRRTEVRSSEASQDACMDSAGHFPPSAGHAAHALPAAAACDLAGSNLRHDRSVEHAVAAATAGWEAVRVSACDPLCSCCGTDNSAAAATAGAASNSTGQAPSSPSMAASQMSGGATGASASSAEVLPAPRLQLPPRRSNEPHWTSFDVAVPHLDWAALLADMWQQEAEARNAASSDMAVGSGTLRMGPIQVYLVESEEQAAPAIAALRASMADAAVAIDLEWRPDYGRGARSSRVALLQLASSGVAVLLRVSRMGWTLPQCVQHFLSDPSVPLVGFGWDGSDERKMRGTFGAGSGRASFGAFVDLQAVATRLGYRKPGLAKLASLILGATLSKSKKVSMSNWEAKALSLRQVHYAALDALVCGHIFRALRLWHASPAPCAGCRVPLGMETPLKGRLTCGGTPSLPCNVVFSDLGKLSMHSKNKGHRMLWAECAECGRGTVRLKQPLPPALKNGQAAVGSAQAAGNSKAAKRGESGVAHAATRARKASKKAVKRAA